VHPLLHSKAPACTRSFAVIASPHVGNTAIKAPCGGGKRFITETPPEAGKGLQRFLGFLPTPDWRTADFGRLIVSALFGAEGITKR